MPFRRARANRRSLVALVVCCSALLPGLAHLRLGAVGDGLAYLTVVGLLNVVQFGAPLAMTPAAAAASSGTAFVLGWAISALAARSAARLVQTLGLEVAPASMPMCGQWCCAAAGLGACTFAGRGAA